MTRITVQREKAPQGFTPQITPPIDPNTDGPTFFFANLDQQTSHWPKADTGDLVWVHEEIKPGQTSNIVSLNNGTYPYHCQIHPEETGTIIIGTTPPT